MPGQERPIAIWLLICCMTIFAMVILGGATRLTGSGLSMVEWEPIMGILPPLSTEQWEETFRLYQQYPEYQLKNSHMGLAEFKSIFFFEYAHRVLGRLIGIMFFIPLIYFVLRKKISRSLMPKLLTMFLLGGLQGLLGWYMVKSGLVDNPQVSQYRLTAHLGLAVLIYGYMFWVALGLLDSRQGSSPGESGRWLKRASLAVSALIFITILSGGFVAGLKAGYAYNTFPLMAGRWIPEGIFSLDPLWRNFFENVATVQFDHRLLALTLFVTIPLFWLSAWRANRPRRSMLGPHLLLAALAIQITLGISTLLLYVPVHLGVSHQGGGLVLLSVSLFVAHQMHRPA